MTADDLVLLLTVTAIGAIVWELYRTNRDLERTERMLAFLLMNLEWEERDEDA